MAVQLPCYFFEKHHLPGECYGRANILETLHDILLPPAAELTSTHASRSFALCGPGQIGKTQIAAGFAMTRKEAFDAVFWINAESEIKLTADFTLIAAQMELTNELDRGNAVDSRDRLLQWVNRPSRDGRCMSNEDSRHIEDVPDWLLVFDNADNPELLVYYWPGVDLGHQSRPNGQDTFLFHIGGGPGTI
ncbi:uncharacterized protein N7473_008404 [Penicillium subrubescens]|uniref:NB-ARC domain-containing protein n=1 Tax=Penicillium subrubescens TaxID=1316194 RepID=A0A1Q5TBV5_9EURO|nr:uncharacterized protein N7473_008404 [Penicillium subrubescens]KAJ5892176.1 hypothetical protein N7473_008404 [Penicillium subrubescens]OKO97660.1 hypothetical protein PENSUB_9951 [Penicillium subrubescens]